MRMLSGIELHLSLPAIAIRHTQDGRPGKRGAIIALRPTLQICMRQPDMSKKFPVNPKHPERVCWGCDKYCPADSLICGNGSERTQHPDELFGEDWQDWGIDSAAEPAKTADR